MAHRIYCKAASHNIAAELQSWPASDGPGCDGPSLQTAVVRWASIQCQASLQGYLLYITQCMCTAITGLATVLFTEQLVCGTHRLSRRAQLE